MLYVSCVSPQRLYLISTEYNKNTKNNRTGWGWGKNEEKISSKDLKQEECGVSTGGR